MGSSNSTKSKPKTKHPKKQQLTISTIAKVLDASDGEDSPPVSKKSQPSLKKRILYKSFKFSLSLYKIDHSALPGQVINLLHPKLSSFDSKTTKKSIKKIKKFGLDFDSSLTKIPELSKKSIH